jgi:hypothetical protein
MDDEPVPVPKSPLPDGYGADGYGADGYGADGYGADGYGAGACRGPVCDSVGSGPSTAARRERDRRDGPAASVGILVAGPPPEPDPVPRTGAPAEGVPRDGAPGEDLPDEPGEGLPGEGSAGKGTAEGVAGEGLAAAGALVAAPCSSEPGRLPDRHERSPMPPVNPDPRPDGVPVGPDEVPMGSGPDEVPMGSGPDEVPMGDEVSPGVCADRRRERSRRPGAPRSVAGPVAGPGETLGDPGPDPMPGEPSGGVPRVSLPGHGLESTRRRGGGRSAGSEASPIAKPPPGPTIPAPATPWLATRPLPRATWDGAGDVPACGPPSYSGPSPCQTPPAPTMSAHEESPSASVIAARSRRRRVGWSALSEGDTVIKPRGVRLPCA